MESTNQQTTPIIVFDTPNVFAELQQNPTTIVANLLGKELTIQESDLLTSSYSQSLKSTSDIEEVFTNLLKDKFQVGEEGLSAVLESVKQAYLRKEKKKKDVDKKGLVEIKKFNKVDDIEKKLVEMADHECGLQRFSKILKGPDFPIDNLGTVTSPVQNFESRFILPANVFELYIVYHYLKSEYQVEDSQFIFRHNLLPAIEHLAVEVQGLTLEQLSCNKYTNNKLWLVYAEPEDFTELLTKHP